MTALVANLGLLAAFAAEDPDVGRTISTGGIEFSLDMKAFSRLCAISTTSCKKSETKTYENTSCN